MFNPRVEAFRVSTRAIGIDLMRSQVGRNLGIYVANATTTFRAGMLVSLNASQEIVVCDGVAPFGFAKYTKANTLYAAVVNERVTMAGVTWHNLAHGGLFDPGGAPPISGMKVTNTAGTVTYTNGTHYNANYINGQIQRIAGGGGFITDGQVVLVTYQYQVTEAELKFEGRNFWNFINDVDIQGGKVTVINDWSFIWTTQFDPNQTYAVNDVLKAGAVADGLSGLVTKSGAGAFIGRVFQPPTADDPFLGIRYVGGLVS
jgi:hypothetical protein